MDIFDKAQDFLDKAQEKVADATTLAAWKANQAVRARAAQSQKGEIEQQIETVTMQLGNGVYQVWKNRGGRDDKKIEELCHTLDGLLSRYRDVNAEVAEINRATYEGVVVGPRSAGPPGTAAVLPASSGGAPAAQIMAPTAPRIEPARPAADAVPPPAPAPTAQPRPAAVPPPAAQPRPAATPQPVSVAPAEPAPTRAGSKPKPCPSCGTTVPADVMYCPHCGYMAR